MIESKVDTVAQVCGEVQVELLNGLSDLTLFAAVAMHAIFLSECQDENADMSREEIADAAWAMAATMRARGR